MRTPSGFSVIVGDETVRVKTIAEAARHIQDGALELRKALFNSWQQLQDVSGILTQNNHPNNGGLDNLLFLSYVKKAYLLASIFSDLDDVRDSIRSLFNVDISSVSDHLIANYNSCYIKIKVLHRLVMREMYRLKLISRFQTLYKSAQISGPWANLDLPMKERVWEWDEGEDEYFDLKEKAKREQVRYNPEYTKDGFFYVWQDLTRDPYKFEDIKEDSPYKSRHDLLIP